ncbi:MAG: formate dehydrogenase accessory sulfurtransferase FdhD [Gammaproteobacteria bacterium]|nr:formate dehydrogenase accessory sulfurtransferase FdhD [Gammaproteobacteria bacterium]
MNKRPAAAIAPASSIAVAPEPAASRRVAVTRQAAASSKSAADDTDLVTVEEPMEVRLSFLSGGMRREQSISVTMRTPGNDFELAVGFLRGEGVIQGGRDVVDVEHCGPPSPDKGIHNVVKVELADHVEFDAEALTRHVFTSSSCGVCGKASLDAVAQQLPDRPGPPPAFTVDAAVLRNLPERLRTMQTEFRRTGGLHASAAFRPNGRIDRLREDVGRHNALDKLIGAYLIEDSEPLAETGLLLSGRASFELVQKAAMTATCFVAAVGPPSSLAVELAQERGFTLVGFLKDDGFNIYTHPERIRN